MAQKGGPCLRGQRLLDNAPCQAVAGLDSGALPFPRYCASLVQTKADRHANGSPFGGAGEELATRLRGLGFGRPHRFLYLFGELYVIMVLRPCPPILFGREVKAMSSILSFVLSVGANVTSYYICKWLDRWFTGRKH